jgi:hypothetical protein
MAKPNFMISNMLRRLDSSVHGETRTNINFAGFLKILTATIELSAGS